MRSKPCGSPEPYLTVSPFLLRGVIHQHLETLHPEHHAVVDEIRKSLYVDDLVSGAITTEKAMELKGITTKIFKDATFRLHKWQSNAKELETSSYTKEEEETYAKQQLGAPTKEKGKLLGLDWDKHRHAGCFLSCWKG